MPLLANFCFKLWIFEFKRFVFFHWLMHGKKWNSYYSCYFCIWLYLITGVIVKNPIMAYRSCLVKYWYFCFSLQFFMKMININVTSMTMVCKFYDHSQYVLWPLCLYFVTHFRYIQFLGCRVYIHCMYLLRYCKILHRAVFLYQYFVDKQS